MIGWLSGWLTKTPTDVNCEKCCSISTDTTNELTPTDSTFHNNCKIGSDRSYIATGNSSKTEVDVEKLIRAAEIEYLKSSWYVKPKQGKIRTRLRGIHKNHKINSKR